jgi:hypothetical protein
MPNIRKFLDISTGHLTEDDKEWLDRTHMIGAQAVGSHCDKTAFGWFMSAYSERPDGMTDNLWSICQKAHAFRCDYIFFDADAEELECHPVFDEETT